MKLWAGLIMVYFYFYIYTAMCAIRFIKTGMCNRTTPIQYFIHVYNGSDAGQWGEGNYSSPIENGNNMRALFRVYSNIGNKWVKMFSLNTESGVCDSLNMYVGEFWHNIQRKAKMPPGKCPMPPGTYSAKDIYVDTKKIKFNTFPRGKMRFEFELVHKKTNKLMLCVESEVENL